MADTGIGLDASEYFMLEAGATQDLVPANKTELAIWTQGYNGVNSYITCQPVAASDYLVTGDARDYDTGQLVDINNVVDFSIGDIGRKNGVYFKGQISNLKVTVLDGSERSRFYPGIIYSYVDPDATDVPMPQSTVLVDEWCVGEDVTKFLYDSPPWTRTGETFNRTATGWNSLKISDYPTYDGMSKVSVGEVSAGVNLFWTDRVTGNNSNAPLQANTSYVVNASSGLRIDANNVAITVSNIKVTKVTHGIMTNFGTTQPYVPLLGDREAYLGFTTSATDYIRGVRNPEHGNNFLISESFNEESSPVGSILVSGGVSLVCGVRQSSTLKYDNPNGFTGEQIQHAFQYPNTFKVIKPTDPDYPDYQP